MLRFVVLVLSVLLASAFVAPDGQAQRWKQSSLAMVPRYDKTTQQWSPSSPEEGPDAGYPPVKTLLLHGPGPFVRRIFQPDDYEQAVLKFMAGDKCSRDVAQGNMDAYLRNPNDWAFNRMQEQKTGYKADYVTLRKKDVALTLIWATLVLTIGGRVIYSLISNVDFYSFGPFAGSY